MTEVHKIEHAPYNKLQNMVEGTVSEKRSNSGIAIFIPAQSIVNGLIGVNGNYALKHVEAECKVGYDRLRHLKEMEEKPVPVTQ